MNDKMEANGVEFPQSDADGNQVLTVSLSSTLFDPEWREIMERSIEVGGEWKFEDESVIRK